MAGNARFIGTFVPDTASVKNDHIDPTTEIDSGKLKHIHRAKSNFALAIGGTPATYEEVVFIAATAGTIKGFMVTLTDTGTSTDIDFDLKKNGTTVLSAVVNFTHSDGDGTVKDGTLSVTSFAADDVISIAMTVTSATGAQGPFAEALLEESNS